MKKIILLITLFTGYVYLSAQEILKGENMEDESAWTITDVSALQTGLDPATIIFNYTDDNPEDGQGGCLNISG
jgi:hypothetical protein